MHNHVLRVKNDVFITTMLVKNWRIRRSRKQAKRSSKEAKNGAKNSQKQAKNGGKNSQNGDPEKKQVDWRI